MRLPVNTRAAWIIAVLPFAFVPINALIAVAFGGFTTWLIIFSVIAVMSLASLLLAFADSRQLLGSGHNPVASPWLSLLSPLVYLAVRAERVWCQTGFGYGPFWTHLSLLVAVPLQVRLLEVWVVLDSLG